MRLYLTMSGKDNAESHAGGVPFTAKAMRIHLAERDPQHHAWPKRGADREHMKLRILLSYWYYKDTDLDALFVKYFTEPYPDVFADSGGFSAMTQGAAIQWQEYAAWVKRWAHLFCTHANLDAIGDPAKTAQNQKHLEDAGLTPLPVFHVGSDFKHLEAYIDKYPYIALGGMVPHLRYTDRIMPWLVKCFKLAQGRSVFHGFGATNWTVVKSLPWYSVDSSSWGSGFRFGQVPVFDAQRGKFYTLDPARADKWTNTVEILTTLQTNGLGTSARANAMYLSATLKRLGFTGGQKRGDVRGYAGIW